MKFNIEKPVDNFYPPINPGDIPLMDQGSLAPLFDTEEEQDNGR